MITRVVFFYCTIGLPTSVVSSNMGNSTAQLVGAGNCSPLFLAIHKIILKSWAVVVCAFNPSTPVSLPEIICALDRQSRLISEFVDCLV